MACTKTDTVSIYDKQSIKVGSNVWISIFDAELPRKTGDNGNTTGHEQNSSGGESKFIAGLTTEWDCFMRGLSISGDRPMYGRREGTSFQWLTYTQVYYRVCRFGSGLIEMGVSPGQAEHIGIMVGSRVEWNISVLGGYLFSMVNVPLYLTLGLESVQFIINQAELRTVIVETEKSALMVCEAGQEVVEMIIIIEAIGIELREMAKKCNVKLVQFAEVEKAGNCDVLDRTLPSPSDLACIMYTSGTTGTPKGVMVSHRAIALNCAVSVQASGFLNNKLATAEDTYLSFLPMAHVYERIAQNCLLISGSSIGYFSGDIRNIIADAGILKPTKVAMVPRLLNRLYSTIMTKLAEANAIKKGIFQLALKESTPNIIKSFAFKDVRNILGGRVNFLMSGGAPLDPAVKDTLSKVFGFQLTEGYGLTETLAGFGFTLPGDPVGDGGYCILPGAKLKLEDIPEMEYFVADGKGELCYKGYGMMDGYYKEKQKTDEVMDADGWFHTGDVGEMTQRGTFKIIDRKKSIFKLSQGEYIAPEKIENIYTKLPFVGQMYVHGDSLKSHVVGLMFPDEASFMSIFGNNNYGSVDFEELCGNKQVLKEIRERLMEVGKSRGLHGFEQVKAIKLFPQQLTIEMGMLTPTMKFKRNKIVSRYKDEIEQLYK